MLYAEMVAQAGISFEAFGLELEMGVPSPGMFTRDLFQFSCMLDKFSTLGRPVFLTASASPGRARPIPTTAPTENSTRSSPANGNAPGIAELQAEWLAAAYRIGAEQAVCRIHRLGKPRRHQSHHCPPADCSTTCSSPSPLSPSCRNCASNSIPGSERSNSVPAMSSQLRGLLVLLAILITIFAIRLALNSKTVPEFKPGQIPASNQLADHIDPNTASESELAAIPELGESAPRQSSNSANNFNPVIPTDWRFSAALRS